MANTNTQIIYIYIHVVTSVLLCSTACVLCVHSCTTSKETLGLSMELNDDILVQTTPPQTIARVKRVKCFMLHKVP